MAQGELQNCRLFGRILVALLLTGGAFPARAADAPAVLRALPAPLAAVDLPEARAEIITEIWDIEAAQEAIDSGFYRVAETYLRRILQRTDLRAERRRELSLSLITALIAQRKADDAAALLDAHAEVLEPAWQLRRAAVAYLRDDPAGGQQALRDLRVRNVPPADQGWLYFLRAMFLYRDGDAGRAEEVMNNAIEAASSEAERAYFRLAELQAAFSAGPPTEELLAELRREIEDSRGRPVSFRYSLQYSVALNALGRQQDAVNVLLTQRSELGTGTELRGQTLLLLGLVAGTDSAVGRGAFSELMIEGNNRTFQQTAILHLAAGLPAEAGALTTATRELLDAVMRARPQHPLTDYMILIRAGLALQDRNPTAAEELAADLLTRFPGSELRAGALALLVNASWQRNRYRTAADYITRLREVAAEDAPARARYRRLAVLLGECFFRAGLEPQGTAEDFRNAAEAYGLAQLDLPPEITAGEILFQRVMSWIRGDYIDNAVALLDSDEATTVSAESRWQAEWNLARFLQIRGREPEAFARVQSLSQREQVSPELRLRFFWLTAQLSLQIEDPATTITRVERLRAYLAGPEGETLSRNSPDLRARVMSNSVLLEAEALLETATPEQGLAKIEGMQTGEYANTAAGIYSYIVRGRYLAAQNRLVEAQQQLTALADKYPDSEYAPQALFEAALVAMRRGQEAYLRDADELLNRIFTQYGNDEPLLFRVLLEQGDIQRRLNQFGYAEQLYLYLENYYPNHPDQMVAQLSLAATLLAQVANDPSKFDAAISRLERLTSLPSAPPDLQVEAGFKLGFAWQTRGDTDRAAQIYWQLYTRFLEDEDAAASLGAKGRRWLTQALLEFGQLEQKAGRRDNARRAFEAVLTHGLPAPALARGFIAGLGNGG